MDLLKIKNYSKMKNSEAENWAQWEQASADDVLRELGETSEKEYKYYMSLPDKK